MNLSAVMDEVANQLATIAGLRAIAWPDGSVSPPAAIVTMPAGYVFDDTGTRGADRITLPVVLLVSGAVPRIARDALGLYCNGSGASSIKQVLESHTYTTFSTLRVTGIEFDTYTYGGVDYPAAIFTLDVYGSGA